MARARLRDRDEGRVPVPEDVAARPQGRAADTAAAPPWPIRLVEAVRARLRVRLPRRAVRHSDAVPAPVQVLVDEDRAAPVARPGARRCAPAGLDTGAAVAGRR